MYTGYLLETKQVPLTLLCTQGLEAEESYVRMATVGLYHWADILIVIAYMTIVLSIGLWVRFYKAASNLFFIFMLMFEQHI